MQEDRDINYYIDHVFRKMDLGDFATEIEVERAYRSLVGPLISRLTLNVSYRNGTLVLRLQGASLKNELRLRRESLRLCINQSLGREVVKRIVLQ